MLQKNSESVYPIREDALQLPQKQRKITEKNFPSLVVVTLCIFSIFIPVDEQGVVVRFAFKNILYCLIIV
jgi:hypothetical protein